VYLIKTGVVQPGGMVS